jgi:hypothetical protein
MLVNYDSLLNSGSSSCSWQSHNVPYLTATATATATRAPGLRGSVCVRRNVD